MNPPDIPRAATGPVIVFDGVCVLCNDWIRFLLRHDREQRYRFAAMQGVAGRALLRGHGLDPDDPDSLLLIDGADARIDSDAIISVLAGLGAPWSAAVALRLIPRPLRDRAYRLLARKRYRWFGKKSACEMPMPEHRDRFLDLPSRG